MDLTGDVEIVFRTGGPTVRHDPRRFRAALSDVLAERAVSSKPQQAALAAAVEAGVAIGLIRDGSAEQQRRWIEVLNRDFSLTPEMAGWAVATIRDGAVRAGISQGTDSSTDAVVSTAKAWPTRALLGALAAIVALAAVFLFVTTRSNDEDADAAAGITGGRVVSVSATKSSAQVISSGDITAVTFGDEEEWDSDDLHDIARDSSRITVPEGMAGVWRFSYTVYFGPSDDGAGRLQVWIHVNGADGDVAKVYAWNATSASAVSAISGSADLVLNVGDFVEVYVYQSSGASIDVGLVDVATRFQGTFLGRATDAAE